jgi:hypothetical protein
MNRHFELALALLLVATIAPLPVTAQDADHSVHVRFDQASPPSAASGPFPSNRYTVQDSSQNTGLRVNLPKPDCATRVSDCADVEVLNQLDGFNLQPTVSIPFDGDVDAHTVTSSAVFLVSVLDASSPAPQVGPVIGVDQVVWDPSSHTLRVQVEQFLNQHATYLIVITKKLLDSNEESVQPTTDFLKFAISSDPTSTGDSALDHYRDQLRHTLNSLQDANIVPKGQVAAASLFTTLSATAVLEKMRDAVNNRPTPAANFTLGPNGERTVFARGTVSTIQSSPPLATTDFLVDGSVGTIAFGKYDSPDFEVHPDQYIPPTSTGTGVPQVTGTNQVYFNLVLPSGAPPQNGWPVAIFGHGVAGNKNAAFTVAAKLAAHGIATIGINAVGHGGPAQRTLTVTTSTGSSTTFSAGGRSFDQNGDGTIEADEGFTTKSPSIVFVTDGIRQTVADHVQLVRAIQAGIDADGDGIRDLDSARIYYVGNSLGGNFGTILLAIEPSIPAGVFRSAGSPVSENRRLSPASALAPNPPSGRSAIGAMLATRNPPVVNSPGITRLAGVAVARGPFFNEELPLRDQAQEDLSVVLSDGTSEPIVSPVTNPAAGAIAIQGVIDHLVWASQSGNAVAYAAHLRKDPLAGMMAKPVLFQFARGDQGSPNPNTTAMLRAGNLAGYATLYRHDLAYAAIPNLPKNPHGFLVSTNVPAFKPIALAAQEQMAQFFESDGSVVVSEQYFEVPAGSLPEDLGYIP